jgi:hypothetical protein
MINQNINLIDMSFLEKEIFELDIKTKNEMREKKIMNLYNIMVNIFYDLKMKSFFKSQLVLITYTTKKILSKFFN